MFVGFLVFVFFFNCTLQWQISLFFVKQNSKHSLRIFRGSSLVCGPPQISYTSTAHQVDTGKIKRALYVNKHI